MTATVLTPPKLPTSTKWKPDLLPQSFSSPWALVLAVVPSELILLFLNWQATWLAWGEMNNTQATYAITLGSILALFIAAATVRLVLGRSKPVSLQEMAVVLVGHVAYLWASVAWINDILPASVTDWIVRPDHLLFYQFTLATPAIGFALLRLGCYSSPRVSSGRDALLSVGAMAAAIFAPVFLTIASLSFGDGPGQVMTIISVLIWMIATTICLGALLRLSTMLFNLLHGEGKMGHMTLAILTALVLPIAGLLLNKFIPFPYNFQSNRVYLLTLINAAFLILPIPQGRPRMARFFWWLRCVSFPFSAYFLFIFLPFLPLSIPAIVAFGGGFLILAPVALFMIHGNLLLHGWQEQRDRRNWVSPSLQMLAAFAVIPGIYLWQCHADRVALHRALDYVYRPDYSQAGSQLADNQSAGKALEHLRDFKAGLGLPFLSETYSWVLFDNLVLPDEKIKSLYQVFMGKALPEKQGEFVGNMFGENTRNFETETRIAPSQTAAIEKADVSLVSSGTTMRARLDLVVSNPGADQAEFASQLKLSADVFIADYALYIGERRVPGQLFEKKSALWVYEKIVKVTRRDPGLLAFSGLNTLDVRIFPVEAGQTRRAELELIYPAGQVETLKLGDREIVLPISAALPQNILVHSDAGTSIALGTGAWRANALVRRPVVFLLVDASSTNHATTANIEARVQSLQGSLPPETRLVTKLVNYESKPWKNVARLDQVSGQLGTLPKIKPGGFWPQRAMREILLTEKLAPEEFPLLAVVSDQWASRFKEDNFFLENQLNPDVSGFLLLTSVGNQFITWADGKTHALVPQDLLPSPVSVFGNSSTVRAVRANTAGAILHFPASPGDLQLYHAATRNFAALTDLTTLASDDPFASALLQSSREEQLMVAPILEKELVRAIAASAKSTRILTPTMAYIVVENSAQWKMLAKTEEQKLKNSKELEIEEPQVTPEPGTWALLLLGGLALLLKKYFVRLRAAFCRLKA